MRQILHLKSKTLLVIVGVISCSALNADEANDLDCLIKPEMYVELSSPADGILESVLVKKSDSISKGQVLAQLESSVEAATVELARGKAALNDDIKSKQIHVAFAKRKSARLANLYNKNAVSFNDKDEADTEVAMAIMELKKARSNKKIAGLELQRAITKLKQRTVKSPISGVVVEQLAVPGEAVNDRPIFKLAQIDPLRVEVIAPTELFGALNAGMKAEIIPEAPVNKLYQATVSVIDRVIDAASGSFLVRLELPNPEHKVVGGLKCRVRFLAENGEPIAVDTLMNSNFEESEFDSDGNFDRFTLSSN